MTQYRSAAIRTALAALLVVVWTNWYDGPPWAWALLAVYIVFTFAVAKVISGKIDRAMKERDTSNARDVRAENERTPE